MRDQTASDQPRGRVQTIRWSRIVIGAVLLEVALVAIAVPLVSVFDNPFVAGDQQAGGQDFALFFGSVAFACFAVGGLFGAWVARPLSSGFAVHGALTGSVATATYLAICSLPPNTIAAVLAAYGPVWFFASNGLRIAGCVLGAACLKRWR